jgi:hypothetical protein
MRSPRGVAPRQDAEAVVLDLVQPVGTVRRGLAGDGRQGSVRPARRPLRCDVVFYFSPLASLRSLGGSLLDHGDSPRQRLAHLSLGLPCPLAGTVGIYAPQMLDGSAVDAVLLIENVAQ